MIERRIPSGARCATADEPLNEEADGDLEVLAVERAQAATAPFEFWLVGSHVSAANGAPPQPAAGAAGANGARLPEVDGYGAGVFHQIEDAAGNFQRFTVQLGAGPMLDFNAVYEPTASHLAAARDASALLVQHARRLRSPRPCSFKAAIAPQVTTGHLFSSRPSIRAYVSGATWDSALKGSIGGPAHANDRFGLGVGAQMESWW